MIIVNPEFHRNLWLKFSFFRLLAMPLLVGCVLAIFANYDDNWANNIVGPIGQIYFLVVFLWGNYEAANSIQSEMKNNTWDFQKMSSTGPWELSIGKLFGSTSYVWYFGLTLLLVYAVATLCQTHGDYMAATPDLARDRLPLTMLYLILAGVMGHAVAIFTSVEKVRQNKAGVIVPFLAGFLVSSLVHSVSISSTFFGHSRYRKTDIVTDISWYGQNFDTDLFTVCSALFFLTWIIVGVQRRMREELQFKNPPLAWLLFTITMALYFAGFVPNLARYNLDTDKVTVIQALVAYVIVMALTYCAMFAQSWDYARYKRFIIFAKAGNIKRLWENTPMWLPPVVLILLLFVYVNASYPVSEFEKEKISITGLTLAMILFTVRDGCAVHAILLGNRLKHSKFVLVFYYLMAYLILPVLCNSIISGLYKGSIPRDSFKDLTNSFAVMFYPLGLAGLFAQLAPVFLQILLAALWLNIALKKLTPKM